MDAAFIMSVHSDLTIESGHDPGYLRSWFIQLPGETHESEPELGSAEIYANPRIFTISSAPTIVQYVLSRNCTKRMDCKWNSYTWMNLPSAESPSDRSAHLRQHEAE